MHGRGSSHFFLSRSRNSPNRKSTMLNATICVFVICGAAPDDAKLLATLLIEQADINIYLPIFPLDKVGQRKCDR